jgi:hypothetical protein
LASDASTIAIPVGSEPGTANTNTEGKKSKNNTQDGVAGGVICIFNDCVVPPSEVHIEAERLVYMR